MTGLSAIANHLWQSTVFAAAAWLLTLALGRNRAAVRYGVWLAASVKFLIPFSWLVSIGSHLRPGRPAILAGQQLGDMMDQISSPFAASGGAPPLPQPAHAHLGAPAIFLAVWLCGVLASIVLSARLVRKVRAIRRHAKPLDLNLPQPVDCRPALEWK